MGETVDLAQWYGPHYFRTYRGAPYERSPIWLGAMKHIADGIVRECHEPRTVLDAGCAFGLLVEALRDRGVDAFGLDISPFAISQVHESVRPYCWVASVLEPLPERYDLIICHEVLEHLPPADADAAVARLCEATDDVLFSSTPEGYDEDTHLNVQPVEYWAGLFARHGFLRDFEFNGAGFLSPWAFRMRRSREPLHRTVAGYERRLWTLSRENAALHTRVLNQVATIAGQEQALRDRPEVSALESTIDEQKEHLDALADRLTYMTDREAELRRLLLDAHAQLLQRDQLLQQRMPPAVLQEAQALVEERTAWAQGAVADLDASRALVRELQATVEERTVWAQGAVDELERTRAVAETLRTELDARTAWALRAVSETEDARARLQDVQASQAAADEHRARAEEYRVRAEEHRVHAESLQATTERLQALADERTQLAEQHARTIEAMTNSRVWRAGASLRRVRQAVTRSR